MAEAGLNSVAEVSERDRRGPDRRLTSIQLMLAFALMIGLILTLNFSSRIKLDRDLGRIHNQFSAEIATLETEQQELVAQLGYVKSDAYVEYWARDEGKMIREGEVLIMPKSGAVTTVALASTVRLFEFETTAAEPENWGIVVGAFL